MKLSKVTLDQWQVFQAVIDTGGFAQAAEKLHRSQSSVSYAMSKLQETLGVEIVRLEGRKARLTDEGRILLQWSRNLVSDALEIEDLGTQLAKGMATEITLVVEIAFPNKLLLRVLKDFVRQHPATRLQLQEVVLYGAEDAINNGEADLIIAPVFPSGIHGENLMIVEFLAVAHSEHPLAKLPQPRLKDLQKYHQVVIRDSGLSPKDVGWLKSKNRWTVSSMASALDFIRAGLGFAWMPYHAVKEFLDKKELSPIALDESANFSVPLQIVYGKAGHPGSAHSMLGRLFKQYAQEWFP